LAITDGKDKFTRSEIILEMKKCTGVYKESMVNNLSASLDRLKNKRLIPYSSDTYALVAEFRKTIEANLR